MCLYLKLSYPSIRINTGQGFLLFFVFYSHCGFCPLFFFYKKKGVGMSSRARFVHVQWPCFCFDLFPSCFLYSQHQPSFCPRESDELWQRNVYFFNLVFFYPRDSSCLHATTWISTYDCCFRCYRSSYISISYKLPSK